MGGVSVYFSYRAFRTGLADPRRSAITQPLIWAYLLWSAVFIAWSLTSR